MNRNKKVFDTSSKFIKEDRYIRLSDELECKVNRNFNNVMAAAELSQKVDDAIGMEKAKMTLDIIELLLGSEAREFCEELESENVEMVVFDAFNAIKRKGEVETEEPRFQEQ